MVKNCINNNNNNNNNIIKSSKKSISWAKKLEDIKIISPIKKYLENTIQISEKQSHFQALY